MVSIPAALHIVEAVLNSMPFIAAVLDISGRIIAVNAEWRRFAAANGLRQRDAGVGANYLDICERASGEGEAEARQVAEALRELGARGRSRFSLRYPCHSPDASQWFELHAGALNIAGESFITVLHRDVTYEMLIGMKLQQQAGEIGQLAESLIKPARWDMAHAAREHAQRNAIGARLALLTPRERQVFELIIEGCANKQIARQLDLSIKTVEVHRSALMRKMQADSLAELVRMAAMLKFRPGSAAAPRLDGENPH